MATKSSEYTPGVSAEAVQRTTERSWQRWFESLDEAGAAAMNHKEIVAWLRDEAGLAPSKPGRNAGTLVNGLNSRTTRVPPGKGSYDR